MITEIKKIAQALVAGDVARARKIRDGISNLDEASDWEINEIVRQAIIGYLKKGEIYKARQAESLFKLPKESIDDTVKQAVLSSLREGDMETITELRNGLPIPTEMAQELVAYCATWGKDHFNKCIREVFA